SGTDAFYSVFVHRLARLFHASFRPRLAAVALASSLALSSIRTGRGLSPLVTEHAQHTTKGLPPRSPAPQIPAQPLLRFAPDSYRLTIPNTYLTISMPASLRSDCCSPLAPEGPFGFPPESAFTFTGIPTLLPLPMMVASPVWKLMEVRLSDNASDIRAPVPRSTSTSTRKESQSTSYKRRPFPMEASAATFLSIFLI